MSTFIDMDRKRKMSDVDNIESEASEVTIIPQRDRAMLVIEDFLHQENSELKKSLKNLEMENEKLKDILRTDYNVNYIRK